VGHFLKIKGSEKRNFRFFFQKLFEKKRLLFEATRLDLKRKIYGLDRRAGRVALVVLRPHSCMANVAEVF